MSNLSLEEGLLYVYIYRLLWTIVYYYIVLCEDPILNESLVLDSSYTIVMAQGRLLSNLVRSNTNYLNRVCQLGLALEIN